MNFPFTFHFPFFLLLPLKSPSKWFWKLVPVSLLSYFNLLSRIVIVEWYCLCLASIVVSYNSVSHCIEIGS